MRALPRTALIGGMAVLAVAVIGTIALLDRPPVNPPIAGLVRQTEIRIAPEITGRLSAIAVKTGQAVHQGDLLATLSNPELEASLGEAKAAWAAARADRDNVYAGVRAEEVAILARSIETAQANLLLARQENDRAVALAARDYASRQQLDERTAQLAKTVADLDLKRAQHAAASAGPTAEERALADARVVLAEATVADLQAQLDKTRLVAPADGVVGVIVAEQGEVVPVGKPVLMLESGKPWFAFTLREDSLGQLIVGSSVDLTMSGGRHVAARVTELRPLGEFATWRAARAVGDHDLNSFRLRLDPVASVDGLQPGMSVWLATAPRTDR
jgi:multidrug resistance efflux pump